MKNNVILPETDNHQITWAMILKMMTVLHSKYIKRPLVNLKFQFDVESFNLKFELKFGNSNESTNFPLKLQNSSLGVSAYLMMSGT